MEVEEQGLQFISDIYGSKSTLEIEAGEEKSLSGLGLGMYDAKTGEDVVGTIVVSKQRAEDSCWLERMEVRLRVYGSLLLSLKIKSKPENQKRM